MILESPITIATWNILLDKRAPQYGRIDRIADTLSRMHTAHRLSAIALQEVQIKEQDNGARLASELEMKAVWSLHSRRNQGEHIGLIGAELHGFEEKDVGHNKIAVKAYLGDVAIVSTHLRKQPGKHFPRGIEQNEQIESLLEWVDDDGQLIVMGDFNCLNFHRPRRMLEDAGLHSAFEDVGRRRATVPTREFRHLMNEKDRRAQRIMGRWLNVDDIYLRNLHAIQTGYVEGASDHWLAWAEVV